MDILSFQETLGRDAPQGDAPLARALEMLWKAHRYAARAGQDAWDFAIEIDEFRRADVCNSELRWLLSQGYATHASETASGGGRRRFRRASSTSLNETSCFIIAKAGLALVESLDAAVLSAPFNAPKAWTLRPLYAVEPDGDGRHSSDVEKPSWDALRRELRVGEQVVKHFHGPAPSQQLILNSFQSAHWPAHLVDPLPLRAAHCPKRRLHDAIKRLNRHHLLSAIRFSGDGSGRGILWKLIG